MASRLAALVLPGFLAVGCPHGDDVDDGVVETAHLRITTSTDNPICAGTPLLLEGEVVRIAEALELPLWPEDDKLDTRHGRSALMAFMNDPRLSDDDAVLTVFEEHFGQSLSQAEQAWLDDDRPDPIWGAPCIPERTHSLADGPVEISGDFDCRQPTVYGASYSMSLWPMCLEVPDTTRVRLSLEADHGRLSVQSYEPCEPGPVGGEALRSKYVEAGDVLEEDIAGCRYRMGLASQEPGLPPTPYTIRIEEIPG